MKNDNSISKLKEVLEDIRSSKYPDIPASLIEEIINVQINNNDEQSRNTNLIKITNIIDKYFQSK